MLCNSDVETLRHFLIGCEQLNSFKEPLLSEIIDISSKVFAKHKVSLKLDLLTILVNPFYYCSKLGSNALTSDIASCLELLCRGLCYRLHLKRYELLGVTTKRKHTR